MADMSTEKQRCEAAGEKVKGSSFTGAVRSLENPGLAVGDEWTFPTEYEVRDSNFGEFILIELTNGKIKRFFPSTFTKRVPIYEMDKNNLPKATAGDPVVTSGTAAEKFRSFADVNTAMQELAGKKVKVTNAKSVQTLNYDNPTRLRTTQVFTINLV